MPDPDSNPRVLLVEGQDDKHVIQHIIDRQDLNLDVGIVDLGGIEPLLAAIPTKVDASDRQVVGIVADANDNLAGRWQAISGRLGQSNRLQQAPVELPQQLPLAGTIIPEDPRRPRIGVWLMPDNQSPGELEDFVADLIPRGDSVWPRATGYIDGIPQEERKFKEGKVQRARVHAWLAAREKPRLMGAAIGAGDLDVSVESCQTFATWLRDLFANPTS